MKGGAQVLSDKSRKQPKANAGEPAGRGYEMMTARVHAASVGAFSSSSLSLAASVDTFSAVVHLRAPQIVARSPSLLKANRGVAKAAAIRGAVPPCAFTLRGERQQTRQHAVQHEAGGCRAATPPSGSPRRPPPYRVGIGQGYSPRLRMLGGEEFMPASKTTEVQVATDPFSAGTASASNRAKDAACGVAAAAVECNAMASRRRASHPCEDISTASQWDLLVDSAAETNETTARGSHGRPMKTPGGAPPCTRERPTTASRADSLYGRLWTGTTAPPQSGGGRPRVLFLVSGQQQQVNDPSRMPSSGRRHQQHNVRDDPVVIPLPPPSKPRRSKTAVPRGRKQTTASRGWRRESASCDDVRAEREGESKEPEGEATDEVLAPGSRCGLEAGEECCDAATTAATDGKGDGGARRVLHVRVPHAPPTSLLVLRSAPPATS